MSKEKKLQVKDLTISFRTINGKLQAVRDISFDLYKGETLAIVGESGSGKSATSKTILGISAANTIIEGGEILYDGKDLVKISEVVGVIHFFVENNGDGRAEGKKAVFVFAGFKNEILTGTGMKVMTELGNRSTDQNGGVTSC